MEGPGINTNIRGIEFPDNICNDSSPTYNAGPLAPATDSITYQNGQLLAQYTSGTYVGQYVNYKSGALNGQGTFVGVLCDNQIPTASAGPIALAQVIVQLSTKGAFYKSKLVGTVSGDVAAAITQRNAKTVFDYNSSLSSNYLVYGL